MANLTRCVVVLLMVWQPVFTRSYAQNGAGPDSSSSTATQPQDPGSEGVRDNQRRSIGGGVTAPRVIHVAHPEFSEEAREDKFSGVVVVGLIVGTDGKPEQVRVLRGVGHGLDEKALEAVRQYRFQPAMENGKPVPVRVNVQVNFQITDRK